jgi:hypothetical protein
MLIFVGKGTIDMHIFIYPTEKSNNKICHKYTKTPGYTKNWYPYSIFGEIWCFCVFVAGKIVMAAVLHMGLQIFDSLFFIYLWASM